MPGIHQASLSLPSSAGAKDNKRFISYFPSADNVQPLSRKQSFSTHSGCSGRQMLLKQMPLTSFFLLAFIAFFHFGSALLAFPPPQILPIPSLLVRGNLWRDSPDAVPALLSRGQNTLCEKHLSRHQWGTALWGLQWGKWIPSQPDPIHALAWQPKGNPAQGVPYKPTRMKKDDIHFLSRSKGITFVITPSSEMPLDLFSARESEFTSNAA